jgi:hypothetical protein
MFGASYSNIGAFVPRELVLLEFEVEFVEPEGVLAELVEFVEAGSAVPT